METLLIKNIGELILCESNPPKRKEGKALSKLNTLKNAFIICKDERILDYGSMEEIPETYLDCAQQIDAAGRLVFPSWVDSHSHLVFAGTREKEFADRIKGLSYEEIAARGGGILNSADRLGQATEDALFETAKTRLREVIEMGTGAIEIKSGYGLSVENELKILRVVKRLKALNWIPIKATFLGAHAIPAMYKDNKKGYLDLCINEMLPKIAKEGLADYIDAFCEKGYFSVEDTVAIMKAGQKHGMQAKIHVNQFNVLGGIEACVKHNARSVDHLEELSDQDIEALKGAETIATLLPSCSLFLSIPYAPARRLIDAGLSVALATDYNPGSTPSGNMNLVVALACIKQRMLPEEAIQAATLNGAYAMHLEDDLGSITKGKRANLFITKPMESYTYVPYAFGSNHIAQVIINGKVWS